MGEYLDANFSEERMKEKCTGTTVLEKVMKCSPDIICVLDEEGEIAEISEGCKLLLGYDCNEFSGKAFADFLMPEDCYQTLKKIKELVNSGGKGYFQSRHIHKNGTIVCLSWSAAWSEDDEFLYCIGRPQLEPALPPQKLPDVEELHRVLLDQVYDMISLLDEEGNYLYVGSAVTKLVGYKPEELIGENAFSFIHPEDIEKVREARELLNSVESLQLSDFRFRAAGGEWHWLESRMSNQLLNPGLKAIVVSSRDISERKSDRLRLEESEQRFKSLFKNNPEMVVLENKEGILLDVNHAVESLTGVSKENLINQPTVTFLAAAVVPAYESSHQEALRGQPIQFDVAVDFKSMGKRDLSVTKIPVVVKGEVVGLYTIANDTTAVTQSHQIIKEQAKRLNTIFESITDAFFTLDRNWNLTHINSEFDRLLQTNRQEIIGSSIWDVFPEEENGIFHKEYIQALKTGTATHFEAYLARLQVWLEVKAFPSEEGLAVYFSDISRRVEAQEELRKLSVVAEKSHSGIIIADREGRIEWVNESFTQITSFSEQEIIGKTIVALLKKANYLDIDTKRAVMKLVGRASFEGEIPFVTKEGEDLWLKVGATPVLDKEQKAFRYIFMITDISLQKQAIQERNRFIEELQSRNQSLSQFSQVVSHQLRSPVANILGLTSLFELPGVDEETKAEVVGKLGTAANNLDFIIKDLNKVLALREPFGLEGENLLFEEVFARVLQELKGPLKEKKVEIRYDFKDAPLVFAVKPYLNDILKNLLSNSIKFRSADTPAVVEVYSKAEENWVVLTVKDNGIGFDFEKHKMNVFGLYKRFHVDRGGRGLGLYLVKTQVEALGGKIKVESKPGEGSIFEVFLKKDKRWK